MPRRAMTIEEARSILDLSIHKEEIQDLFSQGYSFTRIKRKLGMNFERQTPQNIAFNLLIPELMGKSWEALRAEHRRLYTKARGKGWPAARKLALERDGGRCVLSGATEHVAVHHIDENPFNHELENLATISEVVHKELHRGKRATVVRFSKYLKRTLGLKAKAVCCECCGCWRVEVNGEIAHPDEAT